MDARTFQGALEAIAHVKKWGCLKREPTKRRGEERDQVLLAPSEERFSPELMLPWTPWPYEPINKFPLLLQVVQIGVSAPHMSSQGQSLKVRITSLKVVYLIERPPPPGKNDVLISWGDIFCFIIWNL